MRVCRVDVSDEDIVKELDRLDRICFPADVLETKTSDWWVARQDDAAIGFIGGRFEHRYYRLLRIGIIKQYRGFGYSKRLVRTLIRHAKSCDEPEIRTYTSYRNTASMNLLISCGFRVKSGVTINKDQFINWRYIIK